MPGSKLVWYYAAHPGNSFFFPLQTNKKYIYIYLFFHVELCQNKSVWPQFVDSPLLKLRVQARPPGGGAQQEDSEGKSGWAARAFPFRGAPVQADRTGLAQQRPRAGSHRRRPSPCSETPAFSLGARNLREGGPGDCPGHRHSGSGRQGHWSCPLQSASGPWRHCSPETEPAHRPPPHPRLLCCGTRGRRRACWSSALANYCDVSAPRSSRALSGRALQDHRLPPPPPQPEPAPPLAVVAASSDHSNRFPGPDRVP